MGDSQKGQKAAADKTKGSPGTGSAGFQEKENIMKKKVSSGANTPGKVSGNVDVQELMKALKVVRKAKEKNIDLTTSMESLAMAQLKPRHRRRLQRQSSRWKSLRWFLYIILWIIAVAYFLALINRSTVCPWVTDTKTTEF